MLAKILIAVVIVVLGLAAFIATQPEEFRVTRTATFAAPAPAVFAQVNELRKWEAWSPWAKKDTQMKQAYEGPAAGAGAVTWSMSGQNNFIAKALHLVFDMDKMVGGDFEAGLASLKTIVDKK